MEEFVLVPRRNAPWRLTFTDTRNDKLRIPALRQKEALQVLARAAVLRSLDELVDDGSDAPGAGIERVDLVEHVRDEVAPSGMSASVKLGAGSSALHSIVRVAGSIFLPEASFRGNAVAGVFVSSDAIDRILRTLACSTIPRASSVTQCNARGLVDPGFDLVGEPTVVVAVLAEV